MSRSILFQRIAKAVRKEHLREASSSGRVTRRDFLKVSAAVASAAVFPACSATRQRSANDTRAKVAIVGAGLAGLHCAFRLRSLGIAVDLFEASSRAGGRIFTARGLYPNEMFVELGGELIDSNHETLIALARELELELDDFHVEGRASDLFTIQGIPLSDAHVSENAQVIAASVGAIRDAIERDDEAMRRYDLLSIAEWVESRRDLSKDFRELLLAAYRCEFGLEPDEQSALNLLTLIDVDRSAPFEIFGESDERHRIRGGNDRVTTKLADALSTHISVDHRLVSLKLTPGNRILLSFEHGDSVIDYTADVVVLALPFSTLRLVHMPDVFPPDKERVVRELGYGTNAKLMGGFSRRVWKDSFPNSGALFGDGELGEIWETSRLQTGETGILTNFIGGRAGVESGAGTAESRFQRTISAAEPIYRGLAESYLSRSAVRMHWPSAPFHLGSYATYRPGQWSFQGKEAERVGPIHFAGEHTSENFQGFMEGACESGLRAAQAVATELLGAPVTLRA